MIKETICYYLSGDIAEGGYNKKVTNSDIERGSLNFCIFAVTWFLKGLYSDFGLSIIPNDFHTKYIAVEKGVLQGDSFSPSVFNLIINIFMQCVKEEKFTKFGYRSFKGFLPRNWFQFADDAVAVTSLEGENQILLNLFSKWCR